MGSPESAILANLVMEHVAEKALSSPANPPKWWFRSAGGGGILPVMAYTGRLRPKGVPFSDFRYIKG